MRPPLVLASLAVLVLALAACGGGPEGVIAGHIEDVEEIMQDNMDDPAQAVVDFQDYARLNLPDALRTLGVALVELDEIEDDGERKARLEEMLDEIRGPMRSLMRTANDFEKGTRNNREAQEALQKIMRRWEILGEILEKFAREMEDASRGK